AGPPRRAVPAPGAGPLLPGRAGPRRARIRGAGVAARYAGRDAGRLPLALRERAQRDDAPHGGLVHHPDGHGVDRGRLRDELRSDARAALAPRLPVGARPDARHGRGAARLLPQAIVAVAPEGKGCVPPRELHARRLRRMPLPVPDADGDKEDRGRLLIVGGARELPGPLLLAGRAALRAG